MCERRIRKPLLRHVMPQLVAAHLNVPPGYRIRGEDGFAAPELQTQGAQPWIKVGRGWLIQAALNAGLLD